MDNEIVNEPGKNEVDPMDYLSRYPLPDTERDNMEKIIMALVTNEYGMVLKSIKEATSNDDVLQDVLTRMEQK